MRPGFRIIEVWEFQEGFEEFAERRLKPATAKLGLQRETSIVFQPKRFLSRHASIQTASRLALPISRAIASSGELMRRLADSCPNTFSIEIGNERTRAPVA
jgi:hypothetical protein